MKWEKYLFGATVIGAFLFAIFFAYTFISGITGLVFTMVSVPFLAAAIASCLVIFFITIILVHCSIKHIIKFNKPELFNNLISQYGDILYSIKLACLAAFLVIYIVVFSAILMALFAFLAEAISVSTIFWFSLAAAQMLALLYIFFGLIKFYMPKNYDLFLAKMHKSCLLPFKKIEISSLSFLVKRTLLFFIIILIILPIIIILPTLIFGGIELFLKFFKDKFLKIT